jgi:3-oxoacyl-[acyl-carrier protein] reductase
MRERPVATVGAPGDGEAVTHPGLQGKVVLVTGAGSGIGLGVVDAFVANGARIVGLGRTLNRLEAMAASVENRGGQALPLACDVSDEAQVESAVSAAIQHFGAIDVLVNNAGFAPTTPAPVTDTDIDEWNRVLATSLTGAMICAKHVSRHLVARRTGAIVNVTSLAGKLPRLGMAPYSAAKAGLEHLTRVLALELAVHSIRANAVSPGTVRTEHLEAELAARGASFDERVSGSLERFRSPILLGRVGEPADAAAAVLFLASDSASFITGQVLYVDGGAGIV